MPVRSYSLFTYTCLVSSVKIVGMIAFITGQISLTEAHSVPLDEWQEENRITASHLLEVNIIIFIITANRRKFSV